jgi:hypothetical protein
VGPYSQSIRAGDLLFQSDFTQFDVEIDAVVWLGE